MFFFWNPNCLYFSDMRKQGQVKKAFCYQKLFWPFTVWINCLCDLKIFANTRRSASNFKSFSPSLEQFFLTIGQNNFGKKIPIIWVDREQTLTKPNHNHCLFLINHKQWIHVPIAICIRKIPWIWTCAALLLCRRSWPMCHSFDVQCFSWHWEGFFIVLKALFSHFPRL